MIHELTHAAYTIKGAYGVGEKHIFSETSKNYLLGEYRQIGNNNNVEAIVNYISSRIEGKDLDEILTYKAETKAIYMLSEKIGEKSIIKAAWNSDEQQFKQSYIEAMGRDIETGEKSYNNFQNIMKRLVVTRGQNISISEYNRKNEQLLSEMQQILDGNESGKFKDIEHTIITQDDMSINVPEKENKLSFTQKLAKFLEKHKSLMNISVFKKFVTKHLNALPPATKQIENSLSNSNSRRNDFINELSNNGEFRKLKPIQIASEKSHELEGSHKTKEKGR